MQRIHHIRLVAIMLVAAGLVTSASAQRGPRFETADLGDNLHVLAGGGGNVAILVGSDGLLLVDSAIGQLTDQFLTAVTEISELPPRFVVNTHWHFDHVGGNQKLSERGALLIAHDTVRERMSRPQALGGLGQKIPASPPEALPELTFSDELTLHFGGQIVRVLHVSPPAHTDGDCFVHLPRANVLHVGDVWFNNMYPFIDVNTGGSIAGMIAAVDRARALADAKTRIIPGHGPISTIKELGEYRTMLVTVRDRVQQLVDEGLSREEVVARTPTADLDPQWGQSGMPPDVFTGIVYDGILKKRDGQSEQHS